jgi:SAM-dependent methyltransferase
MSAGADVRPAGSYGVDAPLVPWLWVGLGAIYAVLAVLDATVWYGPAWSVSLVGLLAVVFLVCAGLFWHASLRGKYEVWRAGLPTLAEPARVLDLGCGHGAVSIMVAQQFPDARVTGVDLWRSVDQSGNSPDAAAANAQTNGVADRVAFVTGDMTALPRFEGTFDLITAGLAIHNIQTRERRAVALEQAWGVLAPGGMIVIVDILKVREYPGRLASFGAVDVRVRRLGWRMWWSGPWTASELVVATKPLTPSNRPRMPGTLDW